MLERVEVVAEMSGLDAMRNRQPGSAADLAKSLGEQVERAIVRYLGEMGRASPARVILQGGWHGE